MEDLTRRVKHVLAVYLARGEAATRLLLAGKVDEARELLALRNAAFHNLRAHDHRALAAGQDVAADPEAQALWDATRRADQALGRALAEARAEAERLYRRVRRARQRIGKYRAGGDRTTSFTKSA